MTIFAVIVTYNAMRRQWIDHCLKSLCEATVPVTAIVVDNGSTDGTRQHVPTAYPEAVWLPQERNLGFGQANNAGMRYALDHGADYVLLLNQDATLEPDALERMVEASDEQTLLSPLQLNGAGDALDFVFREKLLATRNGLVDDLLLGRPLKPCYTGGDYSAACWLLPASVIRLAGGFNPLFFHYGEDDNYCQRIGYHGLKVGLVPQARMHHDRNVHGNDNIFNKGLYHREMLLPVCDINKSVARALAEWLRLLMRSYVYQLPRRQYVPGVFARQLCWFLAHAKEIRQSRKTDKTKGTHWLPATSKDTQP